MRAFPPLVAESLLVTKPMICPGCNKAFVVGDVTTIVTIGPGADPEARQRRDEGRAYNAVAVPAHWECSTQDES